MIIAVCYDMLRISRRIMKKSDLLVGLEDFFFWVVTGIVVFSMIFQCNDGVIRGYIFLALLIGAWLYNKSVIFVEDIELFFNITIEKTTEMD